MTFGSLKDWPGILENSSSLGGGGMLFLSCHFTGTTVFWREHNGTKVSFDHIVPGLGYSREVAGAVNPS